MIKKKWRKGPLLLVILGCALSLAALAVLAPMKDMLQYAIVAPNGEDEVLRLVKAKDAADDALIDCTEVTAIGGAAQSASVSAGGKNGAAAVYAVGEGWFEIYPVFLVQGRRITETELAHGDRVALLDEALAFSLFGAELPENAEVSIGGREYTVVGTIRHSRSVGESEEHCAYIPLLADPGRKMDVLMVSAKPVPNSGARTMFESTMRGEWADGGSFYSLEKEVMRRTMLLRLALLVFGMAGIFALLRRMNRAATRGIEGYRRALSQVYFPQTIPRLLGLIGGCLIGYAALLAMVWLLAAYSIQPLYVFTEWVPENIVEWSSLKDVFWNLTGSAAKLVKVGTREMRRIEFWGAMLRWGTISAMWGLLLMRRKKK